jgi:hypothetical protein
MKIDLSGAKTHDIVIAIHPNRLTIEAMPSWIKSLSEALDANPGVSVTSYPDSSLGWISISANYNRSQVIGKIVAFFEDQGASVRVD